MLVDKDLLDYEGPVQASVTGPAWVAQSWTVSTAGQLVELRVIGNCNGSTWPTTNRISIQRVASDNGTPDRNQVLARGENLILETRPDPGGDLVVYPIDGTLRVSAGDRLAAVLALGPCRLATTSRATGLWTANDGTLSWQARNAESLRFMSVVRP